jgi:hypothetical protein
MLENVKKFFIPGMAFIVLVLAGTTYYFTGKYLELKKDPQKVVRDETAALVNKVSKLIILPQGEEPTIATVTEPDVLKDQPFFAQAQAGDMVLIYTNAKKAILYSPKENKIVEVAPLNIGPGGQTPTVNEEIPGTSTQE